MRRIGPMILALLLAACVSSPTIDNEYAPGTDFGRFRTYSWLGVPQAASPSTAQRIVAGVDARLQAKGWQRIESGGDVAIAAHVATTQNQSVDTFYIGPSYTGWNWSGSGGWARSSGHTSSTVRTYEVGTLVVDMFDTSTRQVIWRGTASKAVPASQSRVDRAIDDGIARIFAGFPPGVSAK